MAGPKLTRAERFVGAAIAGFTSSIAIGANTTPMVIETTIVPSCDIHFGSVAGSAVLEFGIVRDPREHVRAQTPSSGGAALAITCSAAGEAPLITIDGGNHAVGAARFLVNGGVRVNYDLFRDPAFTAPWQPGVAYALPGAAAMQPQVVTIYGRVPHPEQATSPGTYTDLTLITLDY